MQDWIESIGKFPVIDFLPYNWSFSRFAKQNAQSEISYYTRLGAIGILGIAATRDQLHNHA